MALSNYLPGTSASDPRAPWNQPDPTTYDGDLLTFLTELPDDTEVAGCFAFTREGRWYVEDYNGPTENVSGPYADFEGAGKAILRWYPTEVQEAADAAAEEARIEAQFDDPDEGRY